MALTQRQIGLLAAIRAGDVLKVHRTLDGAKEYRLHPLSGAQPQPVAPADVDALLAAGLIASNMKFPAATFVLAGRDFSDDFHNN
jgi:hypothetical protein